MFPSTSAHAGLKVYGMYIQYVDRIQIAASSRTYAFHVVNAPAGAREFMVIIQAEVFRPVDLKLQDGPGICIARFSQEFRGEAEDSREEVHLLIGDRNTKKDLWQHHPQLEHGKEGLSLT
jgi:hypothetical protein